MICYISNLQSVVLSLPCSVVMSNIIPLPVMPCCMLFIDSIFLVLRRCEEVCIQEILMLMVLRWTVVTVAIVVTVTVAAEVVSVVVVSVDLDLCRKNNGNSCMFAE